MKPIILAKVIEDSIASNGVRLTTVEVRFPRIVAAELLRHRKFSQNSGSSRAIPIRRMLRQVWSRPACPVEWGTNQPGMQAGAELKGWRLKVAQATWRSAARFAALHSWVLMKLGAHKQIANRVTEPYQYISVLISSTDWGNFDELRCHPDADPTMRALAIEIMTAVEVSVPRRLRIAEWHLPYVSAAEREALPIEEQIKLSVARCARISINPFDGDASHTREFERYAKLVGARPIHASPTEHQATPALSSAQKGGNFDGWLQHRQDVEKAHAMDGEVPAVLRRQWTNDEVRFHRALVAQRGEVEA
ncbi:hypothetical protein DF044_01645 [Burkholderia contaminans]|uniref:hypothetical protein n=1 Tax=Burkholderia contaminans TaxID=488447 RepID=UPI000F597F2A|nr:hypothetical protein [Burkholderia contaminans]RQT19391.1 hypothetical protein DF044_01645 [Burkholderia contaminans]